MRLATPVRGTLNYEAIGWRERVALPDLGIALLNAKIDTGARTSALHAEDQRVLETGGVRWVEFTIPLRDRPTSSVVRAPLVDERDIKNTSGVPQRRLIVRTMVVLGRHRWEIELSLANRERMVFDLILGRAAIRKRQLLVDPGRSFIIGPPVPTATAGSEPGEPSAPVRQEEEGRDA